MAESKAWLIASTGKSKVTTWVAEAGGTSRQPFRGAAEEEGCVYYIVNEISNSNRIAELGR